MGKIVLTNFPSFTFTKVVVWPQFSIGQTGKQNKNLNTIDLLPFPFSWIITPNSTKFTLVIIVYHTLVSDGYDLSILGKIGIVQEDDV